jgi:hypothetical protein
VDHVTHILIIHGVWHDALDLVHIIQPILDLLEVLIKLLAISQAELIAKIASVLIVVQNGKLLLHTFPEVWAVRQG